MAKKIKLAHKIGEIKQAEYLQFGIGIPIGNWNKIAEMYHEQIEFLHNHESDSPVNVSVRNFLTRDEKLETELIEWDKKILEKSSSHKTPYNLSTWSECN